MAQLPPAIAAMVALSACAPKSLVHDQGVEPTLNQARNVPVVAAQVAQLEPEPSSRAHPQVSASAPKSQQSKPRHAHARPAAREAFEARHAHAGATARELAAREVSARELSASEVAVRELAVREIQEQAPLADPDIWARMRRQFTIPRPHSSRVQRQADWFQSNHDYFDRVAERSRDYLPYIVREAERRGLPLELALLPVVESAFQPFAYSHARAAGLWQFIPSTARMYGLRINWWYDGRRDLVAATAAAFDYLEKLHRDFNEDWLLAVAAYNWGEGNLRRAIARNRKNGKPIDFWSLKVPRETRTYIPRWLAVCDIVARPGHYGMTLRHVPDEVSFRIVELDHQIDLALAAELAEIDLDRLYRLNAGYRRWATDPQGPHELLVPASGADAFARRVASLSPGQQVTWHRHEVVSGDTLSELAIRYRTSVDVIARHNRLDGTLIRIGDNLLVPNGRPSLDTAGARGSQVPTERSLAQRGGAGAARADRHRVKEGESLWLIARRYGVRLADLVAWNRLDPEVLLMPGQVLELRAAPAPREPGRHLVRSGDNLWLIARRYGVSVHELRVWNGLDPDSWLMPGEILQVHGGPRREHPGGYSKESDNNSYVVRNGDSLWLIARRHSISAQLLATWNELSIDGVLRPGQTLKVSPPSGAAGKAATNSL